MSKDHYLYFLHRILCRGNLLNHIASKIISDERAEDSMQKVKIVIFGHKN